MQTAIYPIVRRLNFRIRSRGRFAIVVSVDRALPVHFADGMDSRRFYSTDKKLSQKEFGR